MSSKVNRKETIMQFIDVLDNLQEKWLDSIKQGNHTLNVYKNPTSDDLKNLKKENRLDGLRVIVDTSTSNCYIFNSLLLHAEAAKMIYNKRVSDSDGIHFYGFAGIDGGTKGFRYLLRRNEKEKKSYKKVKEIINKNKVLNWREQF